MGEEASRAEGAPAGAGGPTLRRELRLVDAVGVGLGAIIGAGIFVVTGVAAGVAGPAFLVGLLLAGVAATCNALSSAQLAATFPQSGGTYEYGYRLLRPWLGFAAGWMFLASKLAAGGTVALGFGYYLARLVPGVPPRGAAVAAALALTGANLFGVRKAGRLNTAIVSVTLLALVTFVLAGLPAFDPARLRPFAPRGWRGILEAAALLFFAYTGYARIATLGEEVQEPKRTIPRAIVLSLGISALLYVLVALGAVGAIGAVAMAGSPAPIERAAQSFAWPGAPLVVGIGATTAMLGVLLSQVLGISRTLFAMARRRDLPRALEHIHPVHQVPDRAVVLTGGIVAALAAIGRLEAIVAAASFTILLYYGITNLAALRLAAADRLYPRWVAALGLACCLGLAASLPPATIAAGAGLLAGGLALRPLIRRLQAEGRP